MASEEVAISRDTRRRRRITERGSDRLALITGQISSLPSDDSSRPEDKAIGSTRPTDDSSREVREQHSLDESDKGSNIVSKALSLLGVEEEASQVLSSIPSFPVLERQDGRQSISNLLTTSQICSAIAASENIRIKTSVAAAVLVILSSVGFPILGWSFFRSLILFRPLYLLLLTNITIVIARLILGAQGQVLRTGETNNVPILGEIGLVGQFGQALEAGLLLQNIFGALFMDFSVYATVLVCGLSLL